MMEEENFDNQTYVVYDSSMHEPRITNEAFADFYELYRQLLRDNLRPLIRDFLSTPSCFIEDIDAREPEWYEPYYVRPADPRFRRYTKEDFDRILSDLREGSDDISDLTEFNEYLKELEGIKR